MKFEDFIKYVVIEDYINIVEYNSTINDYVLLMKYNRDNCWSNWLSSKILNSEISSIFIWNGELACTLKEV